MEIILFEKIAVILFGLVFGSFFNVLIYRLPREMNIAKPRSFCPVCKHPIPWHHNIPVISYIALKGRCHFCGAKIPIRYPIVEILTGLLFYLNFIKFGLNGTFLINTVFSSIFFILFFTDLEKRILPDELTIGGSIFAIGISFLRNDIYWVEALVGGSIGFLIFIGAYYLFLKTKKKEGLGWGDIKYIILIGAFFGPLKMLLIIILSSILGVILWLIMVLIFKKEKDYELPFGSYLSIISLVFVFYGDKIIITYNSLFR